MNRDEALAELATTHAIALRLDDVGLDDEVIARALAVPVESVRGLVVIARSKLESLLTEGG